MTCGPRAGICGRRTRLRADGHQVADLGSAADPAAATAAAIRAGAAIIYQGTLTGDGGALFGRPDFLVRAELRPAPDGNPRPAGPHYEVVDAKLARTAKARAVLQSAFYSRLLAGLQGTEPRWMHLALGNEEFVSFKVQAPVVIYSMATSSADDAPRGLEFLYDLHRLNVATSRGPGDGGHRGQPGPHPGVLPDSAPDHPS